MKRDAKAALMLTLEVGMTYDIAVLAKLLKTHGEKVGELSKQIHHNCRGSAEEVAKWDAQMLKRIRTLDAIVREIYDLTLKMERI